MAKAKPAVHWTNLPEEGAERTTLQVSLPTSSQLQFVASLPKYVQVIPAPSVIDRGCDALKSELVDYSTEPPPRKNIKREDEKILKYKAHVIEEMFFRTSIDGMDRNILFLSNAQASVCTESAEHMQKLLDSFPMHRKPKMVINLCTSKGFGDHARACESFDQKLLPGLIEGKPPFCSAKEESEAMERLDRFMSDVILPFAVETNALIFCSGISQMCALTSSLTRVVAACSQRWLRETPFTLIYTTPHLLQLYGSEHQWKQGKKGRPSDPYGNEEMFWMKLKKQFEAAPWKDRMDEFHDAYLKREKEKPRLPKMWFDLDARAQNFLIVDSLHQEKLGNLGPYNKLMAQLLGHLWQTLPVLCIKTGGGDRLSVGSTADPSTLQAVYNLASAGMPVLWLDVRNREKEERNREKEERNREKEELDEKGNAKKDSSANDNEQDSSAPRRTRTSKRLAATDIKIIKEMQLKDVILMNHKWFGNSKKDVKEKTLSVQQVKVKIEIFKEEFRNSLTELSKFGCAETFDACNIAYFCNFCQEINASSKERSDLARYLAEETYKHIHEVLQQHEGMRKDTDETEETEETTDDQPEQLPPTQDTEKQKKPPSAAVNRDMQKRKSQKTTRKNKNIEKNEKNKQKAPEEKADETCPEASPPSPPSSRDSHKSKAEDLGVGAEVLERTDDRQPKEATKDTKASDKNGENTENKVIKTQAKKAAMDEQALKIYAPMIESMILSTRLVFTSPKTHFVNLHHDMQDVVGRKVRTLATANRLPQRNPAEARPLLKQAWKDYKVAMLMADNYKRQCKIVTSLQLFIGWCIIFMTAMFTIVTDKTWANSFDTATLVLAASATICVAYDSLLNTRARWQQLRLHACQLKGLIWRYRTRVDRFAITATTNMSDPEVAFREEICCWRYAVLSAADLESTAFEKNWMPAKLDRKEKDCPDEGILRKADNDLEDGDREVGSQDETRDDFMSPVPPSQYVEWRVRKAIEFCKRRIPMNAKLAVGFHMAVVCFTVMGTVFSFIGFKAGLTVTVSLGGCFSAWSDFEDYKRKSTRHTWTVQALEQKLTWWRSLTGVEQASVENISSMVTGCESAILAETAAWMSAPATSSAASHMETQTQKKPADSVPLPDASPKMTI